MLHLFDVLVKPVLLYGSEIWGHEGTDILEKLHLRFCKYILMVNKTTCSNMVYGELGVTPLLLSAKARMIMFWANISQNNEKPKISNLLYKLLLKLYVDDIYKSPWCTYIKSILEGCGFSGIWDSQVIPCDKVCFKRVIKERLIDQFKQKWTAEIQLSAKCLNYRMFKTSLTLEHYLTSLPYNNRQLLARFRCRNHNLPVETGCHRGIPREQRICTLCKQELGDEFHFLMKCSYFKMIRSQLIKKFYWTHPSSITFELLMTNKNTTELTKLCKYIQHVQNELK